MRAAFALMFVLSQSYGLDAYAVDIDVGDRPISLPLPDGFVELTPAMSPYYEAMQAYIAPTNIRYVTLIRENDAQALGRNEAVELARYINVETEKSISASSVSPQSFAELRKVLREQSEELYAIVENKVPDMISRGNKALSEQFDADVAVELGGIVPLPIHVDTEQMLGSSTFVTVGASADGENPDSVVLAVTTLVVRVKDKVLFLYFYGHESDLDWTRAAAAEWANSILAVNPWSAAEQRTAEGTFWSRIDWNQVLEQALFAALIGGAIAFASVLYRKRKKQ
jgi:hypothetical protein